VLFIEEIQADGSIEHRKQLKNLEEYVKKNFNTMVESMKTAGVLEVVC